MLRIVIILFALLFGAPVFAQNVTCFTATFGDSTTKCASTQFVQGAVSSSSSNVASHVPTNATLAGSLTSKFPNGVWRDDWSSGFGASPLWFTPLVGTCAANGQANDGGYCVNTTAGDGNSWLAWHPPESGINVLQFGADPTGAAGAMDAINLALRSHYITGTSTNGSAIITSISPNTTGLAAGQRIAGFGIPLSATTILSVDSSTQITISQNANADSAGRPFSVSTATKRANVRIGCGTFLADKTVLIPSNSAVEAQGPCTRMLISTTMLPAPSTRSINAASGGERVLFSNADWGGGDSNIHISSMKIDAPTVLAAGNFFTALVYNLNGLEANGTATTTWSGGSIGTNGINFINSHNINIHDNYVWGASGNGACYDGWGGSYDFRIVNNYCYGGGAKDYGIQLNGLNTDGTDNITHDGIVANNIVDSTDSVCFDNYGLAGSGGTSSVDHVVWVGNECRNSIGATTGLGYRIGQAKNVTVTGGVVEGLAQGAFSLIGTFASGITDGVTVQGVTVKDVCKTSSAGVFTIGNGTDAPTDIVLGPNAINAPLCTYAYDFRAGVTNSVVYPAGAVKGTAGFVNSAAPDVSIIWGQRIAFNGSAFSKTSDATLADVTGLSVTLQAGKVYHITAGLSETQAATGGQKYGLGGTATAVWTQIPVNINCLTAASSPQVSGGTLTAIGSTTVTEVGTGCLAAQVRFDGLVNVTGAGTLTIQFAQNTSDVTASTLAARGFIRAEVSN